MKIAFIAPLGVEVYQEGHIFNEFIKNRKELTSFTDDELEIMPNLALLTLAAYARKTGHIVEYFEELDYRDAEDLPPWLEGGFDLAAISAFTCQAPRAYKIADGLREKGIPVVIGGNHITALPEEALQHADYVIVGEGEDTFPVFLEDFANGVAERVYTSTHSVDMASIPAPLFEILQNPGKYNKIPIQATRGCPRNCDFCSITAVYGHNFRKKPVDRVMEEIRLAVKVFGKPHISFVDENMLIDRPYAKELLTELEKLNLPWECYCDISVADDGELLELMGRSGCYEIQVGLETVNPESLKEASPWKYRQLKSYPEKIKRIQSAGVGVMGLFMLGMDRDGPDIFQRLWDFIRENNIFEADLAIMQPLPGSELFLRLRNENRIVSFCWERYTWYHINHIPAGMTDLELKEGMQWLHRKIHSPRWTEIKKTSLNPRPAHRNPCKPRHDNGTEGRETGEKTVL